MARRKVTQAEIEAAAAAPLKYFTHEAHLADSTACRRFIRRCGPDGYGRFMRLLERLAAEEGHVIDVLDTESQYLLADELWFGDNLSALGQWTHTDVRGRCNKIAGSGRVGTVLR